MPIPSGPRRAGPPRRRPPKSPEAGASQTDLTLSPPATSETGLPDVSGSVDATPPVESAERDEQKLESSASGAKETEEIEEDREETEEEAAARRKRIAERIAKSGGLNFLSAPRAEEGESEADAEAVPDRDQEPEVDEYAANEESPEVDEQNINAKHSDIVNATRDRELQADGEDDSAPPPPPLKSKARSGSGHEPTHGDSHYDEERSPSSTQIPFPTDVPFPSKAESPQPADFAEDVAEDIDEGKFQKDAKDAVDGESDDGRKSKAGKKGEQVV
jgi:hypothetical protein